MRKIERHPSNQGSVITFDMDGQEVQLFVADAKYRGYMKWGEYHDKSFLLDWIIYKCDYINSSKIRDNRTQPLNYEVTDEQLQNKFPSTNPLKSAKENTDILMQYDDTEAAHWCRNQNISGVGQLDLPNIYELMVLYLESDRIDELDPTINEYNQYALGMLSPYGRFNFKHTSVVSSTLKCCNMVCVVRCNGLVSSYDIKQPQFVIPVKEL